MHYIIFDMEWNQPMCADRLVTKPVDLHGEIIQIGAVKLDGDKQILDTCNLLIKPKFYKKMHWSVSRLTRIRTADLENGCSFLDAMEKFRKFMGEDAVLCTWGPDDMGILRNNLLVHGIGTEWLPQNYDLQLIYDMELAKINRQVSLEEAMEFLQEELLPSHDALNDALNTAKVCKYLDFPDVFRHYEQREREYECRLAGAEEIVYCQKSYSDKDKALEDRELLSFVCPMCKEQGDLSGAVLQNGNKYVAVGTCPNGHGWFARIKLIRDEGEGIHAVRYLYELTEERAESYRLKKQRHEKKQKQYTQWRKRQTAQKEKKR